MSYTTHLTRTTGLVTTLLVLLTHAHLAQATVIAPGGATALSGTTYAAQPELGGLVIVDDLVPFQIFGGGVGNPLLYEGNLQARIARSTLSGNLMFYYRVRDQTSRLSGMLSSLATEHFAGWSTDVEYRTDGSGETGPTRATRSADGSEVAFLFGNSLPSTEESYFMHVLTDAKFYTRGQTTLTLTDGSSAVLSTYQPAAPEPGSLVLLALGVVGMILASRARPR